MGPGARTPEEFETLFEDALIVRDADALGALFDEGAVLAGGEPGAEAYGIDAIARAADALWGRMPLYVAGVRRVVATRDTALVVGPGAHVLRRGGDGAWRCAISVLNFDDRRGP